MAKTYSAIQTYTLSTTTSSVTFSNIPQNYTDLKISVSARDDRNAGDYTNLALLFNNSTTGYSYKILYGYNGSALSTNGSSLSAGYGNLGISQSTQTSNTFSTTDIYIPNYSVNGIAKSYSGDNAAENNGSVNMLDFTAGLWSGTSPITIINISAAGVNFVAGTTITLYGIGSGAKATGGTVVGAGNYIYHTFTASGTFTPTEQIKNAEVICVAGGGAGGANQGGGGGAGGVTYAPTQTFIAGANYGVVVGAGGSGGSGTGANGNNSSVGGTFTALGGGGGAYGNGIAGSAGGSGGGGYYNGSAGGAATQTGGIGYYGYGNAGHAHDSTNNLAGAGGGAGAAGNASLSTTQAGTGGVGLSTWTSWHYATQTGQNVDGVYYVAGGGGGGSYSPQTRYAGSGGLGGGAAGIDAANTAGNAGTSNTGGGGGGGGGGGSPGNGGAGGSGLVIIRYPVN
jgi:hypothetical protein